tara:strand:+ start:115 stop:735 length:621 start_codon:yes stop_codon:yes gene_type:complete
MEDYDKNYLEKESQFIFFQNCVNKMRQKQDNLFKKYNFGKKNNKYLIFKDSNKFYMYNDKTKKVFFEGNIQIIGTFSPKSNTWRWGWSNRYVPHKLKETANKIMDYGKINNIDVLQEPKVKGENLGLIFTAISLEISRGKGYYVIPRTKSFPDVFLIFTKCKKINKLFDQIVQINKNIKSNRKRKYRKYTKKIKKKVKKKSKKSSN